MSRAEPPDLCPSPSIWVELTNPTIDYPPLCAVRQCHARRHRNRISATRLYHRHLRHEVSHLGCTCFSLTVLLNHDVCLPGSCDSTGCAHYWPPPLHTYGPRTSLEHDDDNGRHSHQPAAVLAANKLLPLPLPLPLPASPISLVLPGDQSTFTACALSFFVHHCFLWRTCVLSRCAVGMERICIAPSVLMPGHSVSRSMRHSVQC